MWQKSPEIWSLSHFATSRSRSYVLIANGNLGRKTSLNSVTYLYPMTGELYGVQKYFCPFFLFHPLFSFSKLSTSTLLWWNSPQNQLLMLLWIWSPTITFTIFDRVPKICIDWMIMFFFSFFLNVCRQRTLANDEYEYVCKYHISSHFLGDNNCLQERFSKFINNFLFGD